MQDTIMKRHLAMRVLTILTATHFRIRR